MISGHAALALLAGAGRRRPPIVLLVGAAYAPDFLEVALRSLGIPDPLQYISHSPISALAMGGTLGLVWYFLSPALPGSRTSPGRDATGALLLAGLALSHVPADYLTGFMKPTWPGGPYIGLGLYGHAAVDFCMEGGLMLFALPLWARSRPRGPWPAWFIAIALVGALVVQLYLSLAFSHDPAIQAWLNRPLGPFWSPGRIQRFLFRP